jgi:hypothetical protein
MSVITEEEIFNTIRDSARKNRQDQTDFQKSFILELPETKKSMRKYQKQIKNRFQLFQGETNMFLICF